MPDPSRLLAGDLSAGLGGWILVSAALGLVAGERVADEVIVADRLRAAAPDRVSVWVVPGAGHVAGLTTDPGQWADRVLGFLAVALADRDDEPPIGTG